MGAISKEISLSVKYNETHKIMAEANSKLTTTVIIFANLSREAEYFINQQLFLQNILCDEHIHRVGDFDICFFSLHQCHF